jgi:hypothetical protein
MNLNHAAARHLLATSHLRIDLDDYRQQNGAGGYERGRMMTERGYSGAEVCIITLAQSFIEGALSHVTRLDSRNYNALMGAFAVQSDGRGPEPHLRVA